MGIINLLFNKDSEKIRHLKDKLLEERIKHDKQEASMFKALYELEKENKELKSSVKSYENKAVTPEKTKKVLEKLIPILEFYANSKIGEEMSNGTYQFNYYDGEVNSYSSPLLQKGNYRSVNYDPRRAKEGIKIINKYLS